MLVRRPVSDRSEDQVLDSQGGQTITRQSSGVFTPGSQKFQSRHVLFAAGFAESRGGDKNKQNRPGP